MFFKFIIFIFFSILLNAQNYSQAYKEKKIYPMGKKIFEKMCDKNIDLSKYSDVKQLKLSIVDNKLCKPLRESYLDALSLYLFEVKKVNKKNIHLDMLKISKDEKCPVCGMFVYKYPKWTTQILYKDKHYSFDGVKDLLKHYFFDENKESVLKILVRDYYSQKIIEARKSYFVLGSDVYGPMGDELIAFEKLQDAKVFSLDHKGKEILKFEDITQEKVLNLDE